MACKSLFELRDEAESISIQQDVSKGWLVLRFVAANAQLQHRSGFLGASRVAAEKSHVHALALRSATEAWLGYNINK